jgi:hypothetical protein
VHDVSVQGSTTTNMRDISGSLQGAGGVGGLLMAEELELAEEEGKCCVCIVLGTTVMPIDLDDSDAAGDADNASDWFSKKVVNKRADGASSLNHSYTWQVQAGWQAIDKKTKEPIASGTPTKLADTTSAFVHNKREDAQRQGESYRKETRDEAIKKCRDETGCE